MKILQIHNRYQRSGGEDQVVKAERKMLEARGHAIISYSRYNNEIQQYSLRQKGQLFFTTSWSQQTWKELNNICKTEQPDIAHFHNTLPLISPSAYYACKRNSIPVVQTLHNFRLLCPSALLYRNNQICEKCSPPIPIHAMLHRCYRHSVSQSAAIVFMQTLHNLLKTWTRSIDSYIALTHFMREKYTAFGIPEAKITIKPNITENTFMPSRQPGEYGLYLGRLSDEKGLSTLVDAWKHIKQFPLKIAGAGDLQEHLEQTIHKNNLQQIGLVKHQSGSMLKQLIEKAAFLILPSTCYEGFPVVLIEAFSAGKPVIASDIGAMAELIDHKHNGLLFPPGNSEALAKSVLWLLNNKEKMKQLGQTARWTYEEKYNEETNYKQLMTIYHRLTRQLHDS